MMLALLAAAWLGASPAHGGAIGASLHAVDSGVAGGVDTLFVDDWIVADNGESYVIMQGDGNLVLYDCAGKAHWWSGTAGGDYRVVMQTDGNLVIYTAWYGAVWASNTNWGWGPYQAIIQDDQNFVVYRPDGAVWASNTVDRYNHADFCDLTCACYDEVDSAVDAATCSPDTPWSEEQDCVDHGCSWQCAPALHLAARQVPAVDPAWLRWGNYLQFVAWFYPVRVLALVAVAAVLAFVAVRRCRRARGKQAALGDPAAAPLLTQYGATL